MKKDTKSFQKGYKFPIYPTEEQKVLLEKTFGCCRYVYNKALAEAKEEYEVYKEVLEKRLVPAIKPNVSGYGFTLRLPSYKLNPDSLWLSEVSSVALQQSLLNLGNAFTRFFKEKKGYPKFKKKNNRQSFTLTKTVFRLNDGKLHIAKSKDPIKVKFSRELPSEPSSITISKTPSGKYYVSFVCTHTPEKTSGSGVIGIDLGIKDLITTSDGVKIPNPKHLKSGQQKLKRLQQSLSRKQKGSNNRNKARIAVAKQYERISNLRKNHLHQLSRSLINENQVIGIESLKVANMVKNRRLSKSISDASWSTLTNMLMYKTVESQHTILVMMDAFYPSSHICSTTGEKLDRKLKLSERSWKCPHCHEKHDRDVNAAINIRTKAIQTIHAHHSIRAGQIVLATDST